MEFGHWSLEKYWLSMADILTDRAIRLEGVVGLVLRVSTGNWTYSGDGRAMVEGSGLLYRADGVARWRGSDNTSPLR